MQAAFDERGQQATSLPFASRLRRHELAHLLNASVGSASINRTEWRSAASADAISMANVVFPGPPLLLAIVTTGIVHPVT